MAKSSRPFAAPAAWKRTLAAAGAFTLVAGTFIAGGTAANADSGTFNPFAINNGFTVVSQGDVQLNNGEIEGSIAAFGTISTKNQNGYPVIHTAAGIPGYTVPTIDNVPVRILANEFVGNGAFDVSNRDDSRTIAEASAEAKAVVKLVKTSALTGSQRGDFLRITNSENGLIDLKSVRYPADLAPYKTTQASVSDYFPGQNAQVVATNACLVGMYDSALELTNNVTIEKQGDMVFVSGFATNKPNVINYADVAGKTIKMDRAAGYKPTAAAPLIIRGAAGTHELGQLRFEGWSASASADQSLADYIMVDLSEATGSIKVDGFELGSIWAPNADINFISGVTTNGQWFTGGNATTAGGGEVHHHTFKAQLPCGATVPVGPTDPTEPTTPVEPTDPTDPTEPTTPVEPTDPSEPNEPETGVSPETITNTDPSDSDGEKASVTAPTADPVETTAVVADPAAALATTGSALTWPLTVGGMMLTVGGISLIMVRRNARA